MKIPKIIKNLSVIITLLTSTAFAASGASSIDYYENEGQLLFKLRAVYPSVSSKLKKLPASTVVGAEKPGSLVSSGLGIEGAVTYFLTDNIAAELSANFSSLKVKKTTLLSASNYLGGGATGVDKNNDIYMVPVAATVQFHIAPYGAIRPYVGGGMHGTYMNSRSNSIKVANGFGGVAQAGIDIFAKDDTFFNIEVRQHFMKSNVTLKRKITGGNEVKSKVTWNPLIISAGIGFRF